MLSDAAQALLEPGDELVTPWPSYPLYPVMARRARGHAVPVAGFGAEPILAAVNDRTRLIALCNPNDPTGELLGAGELRSLLEALPERVVVLLDEALRDFVDAEERVGFAAGDEGSVGVVAAVGEGFADHRRAGGARGGGHLGAIAADDR